jgi:hypothetical protein
MKNEAAARITHLPATRLHLQILNRFLMAGKTTFKTFISSIAVLAYLTACSGGDDDAPAPADPARLNGIWEGAISYQNSSFVYNDVIGYAYNGDLRLISYDGQILLRGNIFSATANNFSANIDIVPFVPGLINLGGASGSYAPASFIFATYNTDQPDQGNISLNYNDLYERNSNISKLVGNWTSTNAISGITYHITVNANLTGSFTGDNSAGCIYSGDFTIPDPSKNIYATAMAASACGAPFDGNYLGYSFVYDSLPNDPASGNEDRLMMAVESTDAILIIPFEKL